MQVWCCGKVLKCGEDAGGMGWMMQGVFSTRERAILECKNELYFVAPLTVDESLPHEVAPWPGLSFPLQPT